MQHFKNLAVENLTQLIQIAIYICTKNEIFYTIMHTTIAHEIGIFGF